MMKKYKMITFCALIAAGVTSCELDEKPTSYYEKDAYFQTYNHAKMAVVGIYDCLAIDKHYGQFEMATPASDDTYYIQGTGTDNTRRDIAHYMVKTTNTWIADLWKYKYMGIDRANYAIANIKNMEGYEEDVELQELVAQACFLRAFLAFDLIKYWGDVPFKTEYTFSYGDIANGRVSREEIYKSIIDDLNFAKNNLQQGNAELSPEVPSQGAGASAEVMGRANAFFRVMPAWKDFFEAGDERRDVMVCDYQYKWDAAEKKHKKTVNPKVADWYPGKWRREWMPLGFLDPNNTGVNYCPLRYADVVLMAAEAYNETGNTPKAWELLNDVRERAKATKVNSLQEYKNVHKKLYDLPFFNGGDAADNFRTALYWERGFELAFEGQRKYDLLRWGILAETLQLFQSKMDKSLKGKYVAGDNFVKGKHELFPIPLGELQANPALNNQNNPGYE